MFDTQGRRVESLPSGYSKAVLCTCYVLLAGSLATVNSTVMLLPVPFWSRRVSEPDKTTAASNQITKAAVSIEIHVIMERIDQPTIFTAGMCEASAVTTSIILL